MIETYEIDGVKITPSAGGYYDLEHKSLGEPERVRGKERADARAVEIAKAAADSDDGSMEPQAPLMQGAGGAILPGDHRTASERVQQLELAGGNPALDPTVRADDKRELTQADKDAETAAVNTQTVGAPQPPKPAATDEDKDAVIAALGKRLEALEEAAKSGTVTTVTADEPDSSQVPLTIPREYSGQMDSKTKKALEKAGITVSTVVLEENENIPPTGLFVSHNGRAYMISPGEEVDVPDFLLGVLDDAVMSAPVVDSKSQKVLGYRNRSRYPYRRVS